MPLWDDISNFFSGGGRNDVSRGYDKADEYLKPYTEGSAEDFKRLQEYINSLKNSGDSYQKDFDRYNQYGNIEDYAYKHAGMNPADYYKEIMGSYNESPEAKYAQEQAMKASNSGAAASGMLGSGAFMKELQENSNNISQRDRSDYFKRIMGVHDSQMNDLGNYQQQREMARRGIINSQDRYGSNLWDLNRMRYGAANTRASNEINRGNQEAKFDQGMFDDLAGIFGAGIRGGWDAWTNRKK